MSSKFSGAWPCPNTIRSFDHPLNQSSLATFLSDILVMSRARKVKATEVAAPRRKLSRWRAGIHALIALGFLSGLIFAVVESSRYVDRRAETGEPPRIVLVDQPEWMNPVLAQRILDSLKPGTKGRASRDRELLLELANVLRAEPWVKEVRSVRRRFYDGQPGAMIEVDAEFRVPTALVEAGGEFWMIDSEGVKLPERFAADEIGRVSLKKDHSLQLRAVTGVASNPPAVGQTWKGADVQAALDLVKLLHDKPFATDIAIVDVSNFGGRRNRESAQIVLHTRQKTEVRWGRPIHAQDFFVEVEPKKKLEYLEKIYDRFGRVDANYAWIDIRFDRVTYPAEGDTRQASSAGE